MTLSREDRSLIAYMDASGVAHRVSATTNHSTLTNAGYTSRHVMQGTDGQGLAVDLATPTPSVNSPGLLAIFNALLRVETHLHELIYAGAPFNIRRGQRVKPYAVADHRNHVHVSVGVGTFVTWPDAPVHLPHRRRHMILVQPAGAGGVFLVFGRNDYVPIEDPTDRDRVMAAGVPLIEISAETWALWRKAA